jgi:hypothetical protein
VLVLPLFEVLGLLRVLIPVRQGWWQGLLRLLSWVGLLGVVGIGLSRLGPLASLVLLRVRWLRLNKLLWRVVMYSIPPEVGEQQGCLFSSLAASH